MAQTINVFYKPIPLSYALFTDFCNHHFHHHVLGHHHHRGRSHGEGEEVRLHYTDVNRHTRSKSAHHIYRGNQGMERHHDNCMAREDMQSKNYETQNRIDKHYKTKLGTNINKYPSNIDHRDDIYYETQDNLIEEYQNHMRDSYEKGKMHFTGIHEQNVQRLEDKSNKEFHRTDEYYNERVNVRDTSNNLSKSFTEEITISWQDEKGMHKSIINGDNLSNYVMLPIGKMKTSERSMEEQKVMRPKSAKLPRTIPEPVDVDRSRSMSRVKNNENEQQAPLKICDQGENWTMFYKTNLSEEFRDETTFRTTEARVERSERPSTISRSRIASSTVEKRNEENHFGFYEKNGESYWERDDINMRRSRRPKTARSRPAIGSDFVDQERVIRPKTAKSRPASRAVGKETIPNSGDSENCELSGNQKLNSNKAELYSGNKELHAGNQVARRISDEMIRWRPDESELEKQQQPLKEKYGVENKHDHIENSDDDF